MAIRFEDNKPGQPAPKARPVDAPEPEPVASATTAATTKAGKVKKPKPGAR